MKLRKALYGCIQSARLWYLKLRNVMRKLNFTENRYDLCSFHKVTDDGRITVAFHVDDLLITSQSVESIESLIDALKKEFKGATVSSGAVHSYLGMQITCSKEYYAIDMKGYIDKILMNHEQQKRSNYPAGSDLMEVRENTLLDEAGQKVSFRRGENTIHIKKDKNDDSRANQFSSFNSGQSYY